MKIMIISHNPVSSYNAMGKTIRNFFSEFEKNEVCQLYIYPSYPDKDVCSSYYRVTDKDILKSYLNFKVSGGIVHKEKINGEVSVYENQADEKIYADKRNKRPLRILLRDAMWKFSRWYNIGLKSWLDSEAPDCIFLAPGGAKFIYDVALKISKARNIPIVTYIADEYYFTTPEKGFLGHLQHRLLRRKMEQALAASVHIVTISKEFEEVYGEHFKRETSTIMTGSDEPISYATKNKDGIGTISYFGNIGYHRYVSLAEIGRVLDKINQEKNTDCRLDIYSAQKDAEAMRVFQGIRSIRWCGFVSGNAFEEKFHSSELLLHVEAFDEKNIDLVKHSVSTKIADSLACGIPFFAYGPDNISSMKHLIRNDCALVATSEEELRPMLEKALFDREARELAARNALKTAAIYHDKVRNSELLKRIFSDFER